jgi:putative NIF3 family GTP cyclohydrolase 1 type 2
MDQLVTGIVTTMFPTLEVIEKTAEAGANLIIAHETPFYNHQDETDWLKDDDAYRHKIGLLNKHKIAIWRFHDYWHAHKPDGIIQRARQSRKHLAPVPAELRVVNEALFQVER